MQLPHLLRSLGVVACSFAISLLGACDDESTPPAEAPSTTEVPDEATPEQSATEEEPPLAALACEGVALVDREGRRVPELLVQALGDDFEGTRAGRGFGQERSLAEGSTERLWMVTWAHHRAGEGESWDLAARRTQIAEQFQDATFQDRSGALGSSVTADLGEHPGGHFYLEVAVGRPSDVATLYCVAEASERWRLNVGHARALGLLASRIPTQLLTRLGDAYALRGIAGTPTHLDIYFPRGAVPDPANTLEDLHAAGFTPIEPNDMARVAHQLRGGTPPQRALMVNTGMNITFNTTEPDDQLLYGPPAEAAAD